MPDRDQVIKGLQCRGKERCGYFCERTGACYYAQPAFSIDGEVIGYGCNTEKLCSEALELLKEQEPKKRESRAMLPCRCGGKLREHWYGIDSESLVCKRCGFSVIGKNNADVIRRWNEAVRLD